MKMWKQIHETPVVTEPIKGDYRYPDNHIRQQTSVGTKPQSTGRYLELNNGPSRNTTDHYINRLREVEDYAAKSCDLSLPPPSNRDFKAKDSPLFRIDSLAIFPRNPRPEDKLVTRRGLSIV